MSKIVAIIDNNFIITAININNDNYELAENEILVTDKAYLGGDYVEGYFYSPKPFASWTRNKGNWQAPTPMPTGGMWYWNEAEQIWINAY